MIKNKISFFCFAVLFLFLGLHAFAQVIPKQQNPPKLVNDFAHMMTPGQQAELEQKLLDVENTTSNQITIVTIEDLGDYDVSDYAIKLGKEWGVGKSGKNNGVVILASKKDHKINISSGKGLEGTLTDLMCGRIIRNEMVPAFRSNNYFEGFSKAADAVIAVTKGEYKADKNDAKGGGLPLKVIIVLIILVVIIFRVLRGGGGNNSGGIGNLATGFLIGNMLGGGFGGGDRGGDGGGGGFGGFGGGDFGGGGASGSW
ncbi:MAG: TPM domain-containing protein [Legionellales bacterium]